MESHIIDGNNIIEVYRKIEKIAKDIRKKPRPVLIEFKTFRIRGHEEASGVKYVRVQRNRVCVCERGGCRVD